MSADRCRREIAAIEAWIAAHPGHPQQLGALMGWLDWHAELRLIEEEDARSIFTPFPCCDKME